MSSRAHKIELRGKETPPKCSPKASVQDGPKDDNKAMELAEAAKAKARGGKGIVGDSGSDILDYQDVKGRGK